MPVKKGMKQALNEIRENATTQYQDAVPVIDDTTSIDSFAQPLLNLPVLLNEFCTALVQRIVYTQFEIKSFRNPLKFLEGDEIPLGYVGQEIYVNPATSRDYDINDFAGLLQKYESDTKVQYMKINFDKQYVVTVVREKIKQAMVSWNSLETYIGALTNSLYNGAYIDEYNTTKALVTNAYRANAVNVEVIGAPTTKALAEQFTVKAREIFLNMQAPSSKYNAWAKVGGYGRAIETFTNPEDVVFLIRNDLRAFLDVSVLASAFNIDKADLLGRIIPVNDFDLYDNKRNKIFDGSDIYGLIADRRWFRIKTQDEYLEDFRNANNRSMQYYLNIIKMYQYSLFANATVFAAKEVEIPITNLSWNNTPTLSLPVGESEGLDILVTPANANTPEIIYTANDSTIVDITTIEGNDRHAIVKGLTEGTTTIKATAGNVETTMEVTVTTAQ